MRRSTPYWKGRPAHRPTQYHLRAPRAHIVSANRWQVVPPGAMAGPKWRPCPGERPKKSHSYTMPGANTTRTLHARPRLVCCLPSAMQTLRRWVVSRTNPAALATEANKKQCEAPLSINATHLHWAHPIVHSNSSSCSPAAPPTAILPPAGTGPAPPLYRWVSTGWAGIAAMWLSGVPLPEVAVFVPGAGAALVCCKQSLQWCPAAFTARWGFPGYAAQRAPPGLLPWPSWRGHAPLCAWPYHASAWGSWAWSGQVGHNSGRCARR